MPKTRLSPANFLIIDDPLMANRRLLGNDRRNVFTELCAYEARKASAAALVFLVNDPGRQMDPQEWDALFSGTARTPLQIQDGEEPATDNTCGDELYRAVFSGLKLRATLRKLQLFNDKTTILKEVSPNA